MNSYSLATRQAINDYRHTELCRRLCGTKPFGSRHWEYPWAIEQSGILQEEGLRILDVAPDFTFPYANFLADSHMTTFIDLEKRNWSKTISWGAGDRDLAARGDYRIMDVRKMAFPSATFDRIFCISVLEHLVCPTQDPDHPDLSSLFDPCRARPALAEMRRCLKPEGRILLTVDFYGGAKWKSFFERWDIFNDLRETGFDIVGWPPFDRCRAFEDPETFLSDFHGPYITLGFCLHP
jgi:SAM-dependent methyltransferase